MQLLSRLSRRALVLLILTVLLTLVAGPLYSQEPRAMPHLTLVGTSSTVAETFAAAWNPDREVLLCATEWSVERHAEYDGILLTAVVRDTVSDQDASRTAVRKLRSCRDAQGKALPTIHVHPAATCQASPDDVEASIARAAAFDGIICGPRQTAWYFSAQLLALWSTEEARKLASMR